MKMRIKIILLICLFVVGTKLISAQTASPEVISSAGGTDNAGNWIIEWTLGEAIAETYSDQDGYITQGFNQPAIKIAGKFVSDLPGGINIYPNPVHDQLMVYFNDKIESRLIINVVDLFGKKISVNECSINSIQAEIDFSHVTPGIYLLTLTQANGALSKTYRITKAY